MQGYIYRKLLLKRTLVVCYEEYICSSLLQKGTFTEVCYRRVHLQKFVTQGYIYSSLLIGVFYAGRKVFINLIRDSLAKPKTLNTTHKINRRDKIVLPL